MFSKLLLVEESTSKLKTRTRSKAHHQTCLPLGKPSLPLPRVLYRKLNQERQTDAGRQTERKTGGNRRNASLEDQRVSGSEGLWPVFCQLCRVLGPRGVWWVGRNLPPTPINTVPAAGRRVYFAQPDTQGRRRWSQAEDAVFNSAAI